VDVSKYVLIITLNSTADFVTWNPNLERSVLLLGIGTRKFMLFNVVDMFPAVIRSQSI
jgi:hypothetical protein